MAAATTSLLKSSPLRVFTGNAHPALAARICHELGVPLSPAKVSTFKNGEISVIVLDSVRDCDVFLINPTCRRGGDPMYVRWRASCERPPLLPPSAFAKMRAASSSAPGSSTAWSARSSSFCISPTRFVFPISFFDTTRCTTRAWLSVACIYYRSGSPNDYLVELLLLCDSCRRAGAARVTVVLPHYGYARQDQMNHVRCSVASRLVTDMLQTAGCDRIVTVTLHAPQIQGFATVPFENLAGLPILAAYVKRNVMATMSDASELVVVSPDAGGAKRAQNLAKYLESSFALFAKTRERANEVSSMTLVGNVRGKVCVLVDGTYFYFFLFPLSPLLCLYRTY